MKIKSSQVVDTFAEAFAMRYVRMIVTAQDDYWLDAMARHGLDVDRLVAAAIERAARARYTPI